MTQRRLIWVAVAAIALCGFLAWRAASKADAASAARADLATRRGDLTARLQRGETALAALPPPPSVPAAPAAKAPARPPDPAGPKAADSFLEWLEDPKVQVIHFANERAMLTVTYGPFFQARHLTPEQINRVSDLIIKSRASQHDLSEINRLKGRDFNDPEMLAQRDRDKAEIEAGMIETLGRDGYTQLLDYRRSLDLRAYVGQIAGEAALDGDPLSRETADALVALLASATPDYTRGGTAYRSKIDRNKIEAEAARLLTPAQFKLYQGQSGASTAGARESAALSAALDKVSQELRMGAGKLGR